MTEKQHPLPEPLQDGQIEIELATPGTAPYTAFSLRHRRFVVLLLGYLGLASSLTANIYFPLINLLADRYHVSAQDINVTITLFMVIQGIAPSFWSPVSDSFGRRPVFLATFAVYTLASLGLSLTDRNYPALLLLRALQSVGGSAILSISYGVIADVTIHAERGRFLAPMMTLINIGPCIGPVIGGGAVLKSGDPRWCFRALLIFGASGLLLIAWFMPETARSVVGNGAVPAKGLWRTWWSIIVGKWRRKQQDRVGGEEKSESGEPEVNRGKTGRGKSMLPNPIASLRLALYPDTALTLWLAACPYALWFCVQASISPIFGPGGNYGFSPPQIGLCFLPGGVGIITGGFVAGRLLDHNYRHAARASGFPVEDGKKPGKGIDLALFPIERARSRGTVVIVAVSLGAVVGYGWVLERHVHPAVVLVLQGYLGCKCTVVHQIYSALMVDIFPDRTGTAAAANNITRCTLAAVAVAVLDPLVRAVGYGWVFTSLGLVDAVGCILAVLALRRWGHTWREKRLRKDQANPSS